MCVDNVDKYVDFKACFLKLKREFMKHKDITINVKCFVFVFSPL